MHTKREREQLPHTSTLTHYRSKRERGQLPHISTLTHYAHQEREREDSYLSAVGRTGHVALAVVGEHGHAHGLDHRSRVLHAFLDLVGVF